MRQRNRDICAGGGGIPVSRRVDGGYDGMEAVIDKDLTAARLALSLGAERLIILTDVDGVYENWGGAEARKIDRAAPAILRRNTFAPSSMGPKVEAACRLAEATGHAAIIGELDDAAHLGSSSAGTLVLKE